MMPKNLANNKQKCQCYVLPIVLMGCLFVSPSYAADSADDVVEGYKIPKVQGEIRSYFDESPYLERKMRLEETQVKPPIRRRPIRLTTGDGKSLPAVPSFNGGIDLGLDESEGQVFVEEAIQDTSPEDVIMVPELVPEMSPEIPQEIMDVEADLPPTLDVPTHGVVEPLEPVEMVEPVEVFNPIDTVEPVAVVAPVAVPELSAPVASQSVTPKSIIDEVFSLWGDDDAAPVPEMKRPVRATVATAPLSLPKIKGVPARVETPALPLGQPLKSVVIPKDPHAKISSNIAKTRQLVTPPEMQKPKPVIQQMAVPASLPQARYKENIDTTEQPVSAMGAISGAVNAPTKVAPVVMQKPVIAPAPAMPAAAPPAVKPEVVNPISDILDIMGNAQPPAVAPKPVSSVVKEQMPVTMPPKQMAEADVVLPPVFPKKPATSELTLKRALSYIDDKVGGTVIKQAKPVAPKEVAAIELPIEETAAVKVPAGEITLQTPQKMVPIPKPLMRREIIMQSSVKKPVKEVLQAAVKPAPVGEVVVEEAMEISKDTKVMLKNFPSNINTPKAQAAKPKLEIERATVPDLTLTSSEVKSHEALGISIEVKRPDLNVNDYLVMGYEALEAEQLSLASAYYSEILRHHPKHYDARLGLATVHHRMGEMDSARKLYRQILAEAPRDPDVLNNFLVLVSEESPQDALNELLSLESKNPHYDVIPAQIAAIYANQGQLDKAVEKMTRAISLNPENMMYQYNMAVMLDHAGRYNQAIQLYRHVKKAGEKGKEIPADISHIQERLTFLLSNRRS